MFLQVLPVALQRALLHAELPERQLHLAPAGLHAAHLRLPLHLQLRPHLQHHVPGVPTHLLLLRLRSAQPLQSGWVRRAAIGSPLRQPDLSHGAQMIQI